MKLHVDKEADVLYSRLDDSAIVESEEVSPGVVLDDNESNEVVGVEMLYLSKRSSNLNLSNLNSRRLPAGPSGTGDARAGIVEPIVLREGTVSFLLLFERS